MSPVFEHAGICLPPGWSDQLRFFRSWLADPMRVAAVAPSSRALARLMTREIDPSRAPVLELGPGTGVFTRALIDRGLAESDLILIDSGENFVKSLHLRFPQARIVQGDAARLQSLDLLPEIGAVVSGLPLLSMPPRKVIAILSGAFACLRPGAAFYQFTYGPRCPVPRPVLDRLGLKARRVGGTMINLPPAAVYRISRRGSAPLGRRKPLQAPGP